VKIPLGTPVWFVCILVCLCIVGIVIALYGIFKKVPEGSRKCRKCKHGSSNFWGHDECWKFYSFDDGSIKHIAIREKDAMRFNPEGECAYYE